MSHPDFAQWSGSEDEGHLPTTSHGERDDARTFTCRNCRGVVCKVPFYYGQVLFCSISCRGTYAIAQQRDDEAAADEDKKRYDIAALESAARDFYKAYGPSELLKVVGMALEREAQRELIAK